MEQRGVEFRGKRVLLVDEPKSSRTAGRLLRAHGIEVETVRTVAEALERFSADHWPHRPCDHLVTELCLPDGSGVDVVSVAESVQPRPGVIAVSRTADARIVVDLAYRCVYLPKPYGIDALLAAFRRTAPNVFNVYVRHYGLAAKEACVLEARVFGGYNSAKTAEHLGCSEATVRSHWRRILAKTGQESRNGVVASYVAHISGRSGPGWTSSRVPSKSGAHPIAPPRTARDSGVFAARQPVEPGGPRRAKSR